jgi:diguanylate cyclase (GGDEF)-like protein
MHRLLTHQLARVTDESGEVNLAALLDVVDLAYTEADRERSRTDRAALVMCQEMEQVNAALNKLAHYDALTGLPNRGMFRDIITRQLALTQRDGTPIAVFCLDFDRFKSINDTLGHQAGDLLLKQATARMRMSIREGDTLARIGGDEFLLLQTSVSQPEAAAQLAARLIEQLTAPFDLDGQQACIGASIGIALTPHDGKHMDELIKNADIALYRANPSSRIRPLNPRFCSGLRPVGF